MLLMVLERCFKAYCQYKFKEHPTENEGKASEALGENEEGNTDGVSAVLGRAASTSQELSAVKTVDGSLGGTSATTAAPTVVIASSSERSDGKMEHAANAPDTGANTGDLLERQRKLQERRSRLLELERLDKEEEGLREEMRRAGVML